MRKSKIIVPALALLTLSMSAAVTSTVAWFTYVRDVNLTGDQLTVINSNGDLKVAVSDTVGCSADSETSPTVTFGKFRDGSVDMANLDEGTGNAIAYFPQTVTDKGVADDYVGLKSSRNYKERDVYLANKFTLTFTLSRSLESDHLLFFNTDESIKKTKGLHNDDDTVREALRFGFRIKDSNGSQDGQALPSSRDGAWFVWAPFADINYAGENGHYIGLEREGTGNVQDRSYLATDVVDKTALSFKYDDVEQEKAARNRNNYIGTFKKGSDGSDTQSISLDVYVWFEGTDPACAKGNIVEAEPKWQVGLEFSSRYGILNNGNHDVPVE